MGAPRTLSELADSQPVVMRREGFGSGVYRTYVLNVFLLVAVLNFADRQLLSILSEPVMNELKLTDGDFGWLTGPAFAIFNAVFSVLLARVADTSNRVALVGVCVALWSLATFGTGWTGPFDVAGVAVSGLTILFLMRILVGAAEAGSTPANNSMVADYVAPAGRSAAHGYLASGAYLGIVTANVLVGTLAAGHGWRLPFLVTGAFGLAFAAIYLLTVKDPPRGYTDPPRAEPPGGASLRATLAELFPKPTFWMLIAATTAATFCVQGSTAFGTSFLIRTHHIPLSEATLLFNIPIYVGGALGVVMTGWLAGRLTRLRPNAIAWLPGLGWLFGALAFFIATSAESKWLALAAYVVSSAVKAGYAGAFLAIAVSLASPRSRAMAVAIVMLAIQLLGASPGPLFFGQLSDLIFDLRANADGFVDLARSSCKGEALATLPPAVQAFCRTTDASALQTTLQIAALLYIVPGVLYLLCARTLQKDLYARPG